MEIPILTSFQDQEPTTMELHLINEVLHLEKKEEVGLEQQEQLPDLVLIVTMALVINEEQSLEMLVGTDETRMVILQALGSIRL
jgi:hypothetical protein